MNNGNTIQVFRGTVGGLFYRLYLNQYVVLVIDCESCMIRVVRIYVYPNPAPHAVQVSETRYPILSKPSTPYPKLETMYLRYHS